VQEKISSDNKSDCFTMQEWWKRKLYNHTFVQKQNLFQCVVASRWLLQYIKGLMYNNERQKGRTRENLQVGKIQYK